MGDFLVGAMFDDHSRIDSEKYGTRATVTLIH